MTDPDIIMYQLNYYKPLIDRAMKLTEDYVSKHKLVLTGGMAIDLALRMKGSSIYSEDVLPDYDIISDKNLEHANALAGILCKEGLPDINVIGAVHITTVRVRIKRIVLLDATYVPTSCFNKIPYLDANHLRIIHPHYQFIDQRRSLGLLLEDTGLSLNVFNRLEKDIARNNLLRSLYPISSKPTKPSMRTIGIPLDLIKMDESKLDQIDDEAFTYTGNVCISGYVGMIIMMGLGSGGDTWTLSKSSLTVSIPNEIPIQLLTCKMENLKSYTKGMDTYRPLTNIKPMSISNGDYGFADTYGSRISCNIIELSKGVSVCIASVDYLLMELLRDRIYVSDEPFSTYYVQFVAMVDKFRSQDSDAIWWPSLNSYGVDDLADHRVAQIENAMDDKKELALKPKSSYPFHPQCKTKSGFDPTGSHYFMLDGVKDNSAKHTNYIHIMQAYNSYLSKKRKSDTQITNSNDGTATCTSSE